jgi:DNA processing protein
MRAAHADPAWLASERNARVALSFLAEPGDAFMGAMLGSAGAIETFRAVLAEDAALAGDLLPGLPGRPGSSRNDQATTDRHLARLRSRLDYLPTLARIDLWERNGFRLVCPGEPEWPTQLDDLRETSPVVLWLRGAADLRFACLRSVAVVGSRAASAYGSVVASELAGDLAARGVTIISGGAYGIDACAHRAALTVGGSTVAVLASGLEVGYPLGHTDLFAAIAQTGLVVSESPPQKAPTRPGFLVRNRLIAALSRGAVIVEAALRSGALNTARHARELNRPVMAVPGPVTSAQSAGCHELIRDWAAVCVTQAADVMELISPLGDECTAAVGAGAPDRDPAVPAEHLDPVTASVLQTMSTRTGRGPATIATLAGVDLDTAIRCLGLLAAAGYAERCDQGWRARRTTQASR